MKYQRPLATVQRMGLPTKDAEAFAFLKRYKRRTYGQTTTEEAIKDIQNEMMKLHRQ